MSTPTIPTAPPPGPTRATRIPPIPTTVFHQHWASKRWRIPTWLIIVVLVLLPVIGGLIRGGSSPASAAKQATPASTQTLSTTTFNRGAWQQAVDAKLTTFTGNTASQLGTITYQYCALETSSVGITTGLGRQQLVGAAQWLNDKYTELAVQAKPVAAAGLLADVKAYCGSDGSLLTP